MRLLVLAVAVVLVLAGAFWLLQDDAQGPEAPTLRPLGARTAAPGEQGQALDPQLRAATPSSLPVASLQAPDAPRLDAPAATALQQGAQVSGLLVDEAGAPVAGEFVDLFVERDRWEPTARWPAPLRSPGSLPLARARSDAEGRFALAARAGATHVLRAGGGSHPRTTVYDVHRGDALTVVLPPPRELLGQVVDAASGLPLAAAQVSVQGEGVHIVGQTDDEGRFRLAPLPAEALFVAAWAPGHEVALLREQVPEFDEPILELAPGRAVVGRIIDRETDEPVIGAEVRYLLDTDARAAESDDPLHAWLVVEERVVVSDETGGFVIEDGVSLGFRLEVAAQGFRPRHVERHRLELLREGREVLVKLTPERPLLVDVQAEGVAQAGATLRVTDELGVDIAHALTDAQGHAEPDLADWDGERRLWLHGRDGAGRLGRLSVGRKLDEPVLLELREPFPFVVRVERDEQPVQAAQVAVFSGSKVPWLASTDAEGLASVALPLARDGGQTLLVQARLGSDHSLAEKLVLDGGPSLDEPFVLALDGGAFIEGQVVDPWGVAVPGARLASQAHADAEGRFRVGPLQPDTQQRINVFADGYRRTRLESLAPASDVLVVLEPVVQWEGRVVDAGSGLPPEDFEGLLEREVVGDQGPVWKPTKARLTRATLPGEFRLDLPEAGRFRVRVLVRDHLPAFSDVIDFDGVNAPPFAEVVSAPAAVLEVLVLDTTGEPVPGVDLSLAHWQRARDFERPSGRATRGAVRRRSDSSGRVRFDLGTGGSYRLAGRAEWLLPGRLDVLPGPPREQIVRVGATGDLIVRVLDEAGQLLSAKLVLGSARDAAFSVKRVVRTDPASAPDGARIERILPGRYELSVSLRGHHAPVQQVLVAPARTGHVDVHALPGKAAPKAKKAKAGGKQAAKSDAKPKGGGKSKGGKAKDR